MRYCLLLILSLAFVLSTYAQDEALIQLLMDETNLQTGQRYEVRIEVQNVEELWAADLTISYDPSQIYVIGTEAGSPVRIGEFLAGGDTIFNRTDATTGELRYAFSIFSPADPVSGTGVIGRFEIVPLLAGTAQFRFETAEVYSVEFVLDANGQRIGADAVPIPFLPVLLEVNISGDPATPPSEATATPTATPTLDPLLLGENATELVEPTLVNITAAPRTPSPEITVPEAASNDSLLFIGIGIVILAAIGFLILFVIWRRRS